MATRWIILVGIGLSVAFLATAIVLLVALLANPRTRPIGQGVIGVLGGGLVLFAVLIMMRVNYQKVPVQRTAGPGGTAGAVASLDGPTPVRVGGSDSGSPALAERELSPTEETDRPAWVDREAWREGDVYRMVVVSDPFTTRGECERDLGGRIVEAAQEYAGRLLGPTAETRLGITPAYVWERAHEEEWTEDLQSSVGPMKRVHVLLKFDTAVRSDLEARWQQFVLAGRLGLAGGGAALVLLLVGTLFGYLKLDTATRGYYTGRLQLAAATLILGVLAAAGVFLARLG